MAPTWAFLCIITCYMTVRPMYMLHYCGENMCVCDNKAQSALCKSPQMNNPLSFFPGLPSYIISVTFKNFFRPTITREDLRNLTHLSLKYLSLECMDIMHMEKGLFQTFSSLRNLSISHNGNLSSTTLREACQNISTNMTMLDLTSNNMSYMGIDMFKHLTHTKLKYLYLKRNPLLNLSAETFKNLNLTTLDLSFSSFNDFDLMRQNKSTYLISNLENLHLQSTRVIRLSKNVLKCFPKLKTLHLEDNMLNSFPSFCDTFHNLPNFTAHLQELYLRNTGIKGNVSSEALRCLSKLIILDLDKNRLINPPNFCNPNGQSRVPNLTQLNLDSTSISIIRTDSFKCLSSLQTLDLKNNLLKKHTKFCMEDNSSYIPNLSFLSLCNTSITYLNVYEFRCLGKLKKQDLRNNNFREVPSFCDKSNKSINPSLINLDLSGNKIQFIFPNSFRCLSSLKTLTIKYLPILILENNIFSPLISLKYLEIGYLRELKKIKKHAFNISSIINLKFTFNNFHFENLSKYSPEYLFKSCQHVTTLILSGNYFPTGPPAQTILKPLKYLTKLALDRNRMHTIHRDTFRSSRTLKVLHLNYNKLINWHENVFKNLSNYLTDLNLAQNKIAIFNKTSVPMNILNNLETFNLAYNPFNCSCDMIWFKEWSMKTNVYLSLFPHLYQCQSPANMAYKTLLSLTITEEDCREKNLWLMIILTASAGALLLFGISITMSVQMPTIKNYMYYLRLRKMEYVKLINEQEFTYDAFIVYCEADENWVIQSLVVKLELEGFRLCIPDREFDVGAQKCDQIVAAFKESKKILVILSNNFAKNEWCLWQMNLVEERLRQSGNSSAVFVLYKSINSKNMISSLHRTLKEQSIVTWYEGGTREKVFWKVVGLALGAPLGEPPISVIQ